MFIEVMKGMHDKQWRNSQFVRLNQLILIEEMAKNLINTICLNFISFNIKKRQFTIQQQIIQRSNLLI